MSSGQPPFARPDDAAGRRSGVIRLTALPRLSRTLAAACFAVGLAGCASGGDQVVSSRVPAHAEGETPAAGSLAAVAGGGVAQMSRDWRAAWRQRGPAMARDDGGRNVVSLLEQRERLVVMQGWDYSCGAASLATLLNFQHGDPVTEREIAMGLMARPEYVENPFIVNVRQGFSLADLKLYVDARGYRGRGLGRVSLDGLVDRAPAMVPIMVNGSSHFVIFRGRRGNRVLLGDPLFGNRTMTIEQFLTAWPDYGDHGRVAFVVERLDGLPPPNRLDLHPHDFPTLS